MSDAKTAKAFAEELAIIESSLASLRGDLVRYDLYGTKKLKKAGAQNVIKRLGSIESLVNAVKVEVREGSSRGAGMKLPSRESVQAFLAQLEVDGQRVAEQEAEGWLVIDVDDETGKPTWGRGLYPTAEAALIAAGESDAEDQRLDLENWSHLVIPMYPVKP